MAQNSSTKVVEVGVETGSSVVKNMVALPTNNTSDNSRSGSSVFVSEHQRVGKYQILAELGRGGAASVSLAVTHGKGDVRKLVVLKALLPELADEPTAVSSFLDEARLAAQLSHPNVVQTYEVGTESNRHVIVMEYLDGPSLSRVTRIARRNHTGLPLSYHLHIISEVLQGLHYAHEVKSYEGKPLKLVHRDVSPQNVIVTYDGQVKILDFGIAKAASSSTHTAAGIMKGKIAYMAPEQMAGTVIDRRADIYSVGCMLWAAVTGEKLWQDVSDVQVVRSVVAGRIPSPKTVNPDCPDELEQIVMRALQPDPEKRYETAADMQLDLENYCEKQGYAVKQRDVGKLVSEMFADARSEFNENLERELASVLTADSLNGKRDTIVDIDGATSMHPSRITSNSAVKGTGSSANAGEIASVRRRRSVIALIGAVVLVGGVFLGFRMFSSAPAVRETVVSPPGEPTGPSRAAPTETKPQDAVSDVTVQLSVTPSDANLVLDGRSLGKGTTKFELPISDTLHELRVDAEGYVGQVQSFKVSGPFTIALSLVAKPGIRKTPVRGRVGSHVVSPPSTPVVNAPKAAEPASCENPFFVDAQGIKRVRPNCL